MKNYVAPQMNVVLLEIEDIITSSQLDIELEAGNMFV